VWACAPERRAAWHVRNNASHPDVNNGRKNVNYWSLGVEIVNTQNAQVEDPFSDWQVKQVAALVRYAWSRYPDLVDVVSHAKLDDSRRSDPGKQFPWERFREMVLAPTPMVAALTPMVVEPIQIIGPDGRQIDCDPRLSDGAILVEPRALMESLGFRVKYDDGPPTTMRILKAQHA
jgi:N-acetylmuramoyl-L-alanine amidase